MLPLSSGRNTRATGNYYDIQFESAHDPSGVYFEIQKKSGAAHGLFTKIDQKDARGKPYLVKFDTGDEHHYSIEQFTSKFVVSTDNKMYASAAQTDVKKIKVGMHVKHLPTYYSRKHAE